MFKHIFLLSSFLNLIVHITAESPCGDWLSYRDEKCFKIIDSVTTETEAESICQKQLNGTFGVIRSAEEQEIVYNYLKTKSFADNVWIGLKKVNNTLKALDGSTLKYSNWNTGRPTNKTGLDCVEMLVDYQGKWSDVKCEKKNAILCEKNQAWSIKKIEIILQELRKNYNDKFRSLDNKIDAQKNEIDHLKQNPVPIGFIYVQLSGKSEPHTLWPNTKWENVSKKYAGLFFRAEGGGSREFGQIQNQRTQSLFIKSLATGRKEKKDWQNGPIAITEKFEIPILSGTESSGTNWAVQLKHGSEEICPRNQAIRIWERIK